MERICSLYKGSLSVGVASNLRMNPPVLQYSWILLGLITISFLSCVNGDQENQDFDIGTALFVSRDRGDSWSSETGTVVTSFQGGEPVSSVRRLGKHLLKGFTPHNFWKTSSRSLTYSGCSETQNSIASIVECSNSVRLDPDLFVNDYPCSYDDWRNEVSGRNLVTLKTGSLIMRLAQLHTDDQARMNSMTHQGSDGSNLQIRADRLELPWGRLGENVAAGFFNAKAVVMAWMCSESHRKNLMSCDFSQIGVGAGNSAVGRNFYTQVFSCDLGETCECGSGDARKRQRRRNRSRENAQLTVQQIQSTSNCSWVSDQWNCTQQSSPSEQQYNPYGY